MEVFVGDPLILSLVIGSCFADWLSSAVLDTDYSEAMLFFIDIGLL